MATPKRRSRRIAGQHARNSAEFADQLNGEQAMLGSLLEREPTPDTAPSLDAVASTDSLHMPGRYPSSFLESAVPSAASSVSYPALPLPSRPSTADMAKPPPVFGNGPPSTAVAHQETSKPYPTNMSIPSSNFEFRFARPSAELGTEAQKMMDDLREEALKIKQRLEQEQTAVNLKNDQLSDSITGRKFAKPKSRFSDAHSNEFGKMKSITGHSSLHRSKRNANLYAVATVRNTVQAVKPESPKAKGLTGISSNGPQRSLKRSTAMAGLNPEATKQRGDTIVERSTAPKRPRMSPIKEDAATTPTTASRLPRSKSGLPSYATTPTASSLARSQSTRTIGKSSTLPRRAPTNPLKSCLVTSKPSAASPVRSIADVGKPRFTSHSSPVKSVSFDPSTKPASGRPLPAPPVNLPKSNGLRARFSEWVHRHGAKNEAEKRVIATPPRHPNLALSRPSSVPPPSVYASQETKVFGSPCATRDRGAASGEFSFRSGQKPVIFGSDNRAKTIRAVRPSFAGTEAAVDSFAKRMRSISEEPGMTPSFSSASRKRSRDEFELDEVEEEAGHRLAGVEDGERSPKKVKTMLSRIPKTPTTIRAVPSYKKGSGPLKGISLGRLNALATPKRR